MARRVVTAAVVVGILCALPLAAIAVYPNYDWVDHWGSTGTALGQLQGPAGVEQGPYGEVFVADDDNHRIQVFDADGTALREFGTDGSGPGQMHWPWLMEVTDDGIIYLADYGNDRISIWDTAGNYHYSIGTIGSGDGQLDSPTDVALGPDGNLYIADYGNHRIDVLEPDGTFVRKWGSFGAADEQFVWPIAVEFDREGRLWVADSGNDRLQYFTPMGDLIGKMGSTGSGPGEFDEPYDIKFDPHGNMYVVELTNHRVQKFSPTGAFLTQFGTEGSGDGQLQDPCGVEPLEERYVAVGDLGNDRVSRWFTAVPTADEPIAGANRYETAVKASEAAYPNGLMEDPEGFKTVVIATGRNWPDALGGSALAGVLEAPILLVDTTTLPSAVSAEIIRLGADRAIVLGGTGAVSASVAAAIDAIPGVEVARIGGADRYATAELIAEKIVTVQGADYDNTAFVATGANFPDALACSPVAAANGWPLYLAPASGLRESTLGAMQNDGVVDAYVLGGTGAVSASTEAQLNTLLGDASVDRISGDDRYDTAVEIGWWAQAQANMNWTYTALATGKNFPDALTGGPMQARDRSIMLLTRGDKPLEPTVSGAIEDHKNAIWTMRYLGGVGVVTQDVRDEVGSLLY